MGNALNLGQKKSHPERKSTSGAASWKNRKQLRNDFDRPKQVWRASEKAWQR